MLLHELKKVQLQERFMLLTQVSVGRLRANIAAYPLSIEKRQAFEYESSLRVFKWWSLILKCRMGFEELAWGTVQVKKSFT